MATTTDLDIQGGRARASGLVFGEGIDRDRLFRHARRHSVLVRLLRIGLPVTALAMCAYYAVAMRLAMGVGGLKLPNMPVITADALKMDNPRYEGFTKDGGRFVVTARTAEQDIRDRKAPVQLTTVDGKLTQPDQSVTDLKATRGTFDNTHNQLELYDGIDVVSQSGMKAKLSRATVFTKEHRIESKEPVAVEMPTATVRSRQMTIEQKSRQVAFTHGVAARLTPERKAGAAPAATPAAGQPRAFGSGDTPVDVTAERLDIDDAAKTAVFKGSVRAVQGEAVIETEEMQIGYEGNAAAGVPGQKAAAPGADPNASKLKRIIAPGPVVMTQGADKLTGDTADFDAVAEVARVNGRVVMTSGTDRRAVGDRAEMDQRNDTVLLTGAVHVVQGRNEIKGRRMWVDRKGGRAQVTSPADQGGNGRIWTRMYQAEASAAGGAKKSAAKAAQPAEETASMGIAAFKSDPTAPIDVEAASLDVNDTAKTAVYRSDVRVVQGEFRMQTAEMTAFYSGQTGMTLTSTAREPQAKPQTQLIRIEARKGVTMTGKDGQTAQGDWADYDVKSNQVVLGGDVKLSQGQTVVRGTKLVFDLTTGEARFPIEQQVARGAAVEPMPTFVPNKLPAGPLVSTPLFPSAQPPAAPGQPTVAIPGGQGPFTPETTGRPRMVLHPQHFKGALKKDDKGAAQPQAAPAGNSTTQPADATVPRKRRTDPADDPLSVFGATSRN